MSYKLIQGRKKWSTPLTDAEYQLRRAQNTIGVLKVVINGDIAVGIFSKEVNGRRNQSVSTFQMYTDHKTLGDMVGRLIPNTEGLGVYLKEETQTAIVGVNYGIERSHHLKVLGEREDLKEMVKNLTKQLGNSKALAEIESDGADKTAELCLDWMRKATNLESENEQLKSKLRKISGILTQ